MIISKTPFRISFFGGGTDYPAWYRENGGTVVCTTIDKYCYLSCRYLPPFFEHKFRIVYSKIETVKEISKIEHPAVKAVLEWARCTQGVEIHYDGDLPARSGLGSSSAFTVGLLNAMAALRGEHLDKHQLACEALRLEQDVLKEHVGSQDQICAAYGGFQRIDFHTSGKFEVSPLILPEARIQDLESHLLLVFTGFSRTADQIAQAILAQFKNRRAELRAIHQLVGEALSLLRSQGPINDFGKLLHESWEIKKSLAPVVTSSRIDEIYQEARKAGATGGKLIGAGGGGFMLLFVQPEKREKVANVLSCFVQVPIKFETGGSRIVLYQPAGLT